MQEQDILANKTRILYVDDEEKSLENFSELFGDDYEVFTAAHSAEALKVLEEQNGAFSLIISDQKMPEMTGAELLGKVRDKYPKIIRLLTTAYSDLKSAIAAVNEGFIYHYVTKPWNIDELELILKQATNYWAVLRERDGLLNEKIQVVQRMMLTDRARSLSVISAGLSSSINNSLAAVDGFTQTMLKETEGELPFANKNFRSQLIKEQAGDELTFIVDQVSSFLNSFVSPAPAFEENVSIESVLKESMGETVELSIGGELPSMKLDKALAQQAFELLSGTLTNLFTESHSIKVEVKPLSEDSLNWASINLQVSNGNWSIEQLQSLFSIFDTGEDMELSLNFLKSYFIIYHHGGKIEVSKQAEAAGLTVLLPSDPSKVESSVSAKSLVKNLFAEFEEIDIAKF